MRFLALLLQLPLFAIFVWVYVVLPRNRVRSPASRWYDVGAAALALGASVLAMLLAYSADMGHVGPIWKQVMAVLAAFHTFPLVLLLAWLLRGRLFAPRRA